MHWNLAFALLPIASQWEFTHNVTAAAAVYELMAGHMDWWACYLHRTQTSGGGYEYRDTNLFNPDAEHEGQLVPDPMIGLALIARSAAITVDMAVGLGRPPPPAAIDILLHLTAYPTTTIPAPLPAGNFTVMNNTRLAGDYRMGSEPTVAACEAACNANPQCRCFTYCPSPATPGCPLGPSCWFYTANSSAHDGPGFTAGCRAGQPPPGNQTVDVWAAYAGATAGGSDTFAFYPAYPAESSGGVQPMPWGDRLLAQASTFAYVGDWAHTSRPLDVFVASTLALAGGGPAPAAPASFSASDVLAGLEAWLAADFGRNQLGHAPGGGIENAGVSRAVTEMLLGSGVLVPAVTPDGQAPGARWFARLFPVWAPKDNQTASFAGLLAKGGCAYSATLLASGQIASPVVVSAAYPSSSSDTTASNCTVLSPWPGHEAEVAVSCGGTPVPARWIPVPDGTGTAPGLTLMVPLAGLDARGQSFCTITLASSKITL